MDVARFPRRSGRRLRGPGRREDTFRYARFTFGEWENQPIAAAGRTLFGYHDAEATLDRADPSRLVLGRTIAGQNEIELRRTADGGRTWMTQPLTHDSDDFNVRPVIPRTIGEARPGSCSS